MPITISGSTGIAGVDGSASTPALQGTDTNTGVYFGADTISFSEGGALVGQFDSSANFQFNSGYGSVATAYGCRAWVNFDGTGTPAIRASGNVTSITDNGNGDYTVNFTNAMPDANYAVTATVRRDETSTNNSAYASVRNVASAAVAGSVRMFTVLPATPATGQDVQAFFVAIFR
jgi:hypothetical protein